MVFFQEIYIIQSQWLYTTHVQGTCYVGCVFTVICTFGYRITSSSSTQSGTIDFTTGYMRLLFEGGHYLTCGFYINSVHMAEKDGNSDVERGHHVYKWCMDSYM